MGFAEKNTGSRPGFRRAALVLPAQRQSSLQAFDAFDQPIVQPMLGRRAEAFQRPRCLHGRGNTARRIASKIRFPKSPAPPPVFSGIVAATGRIAHLQSLEKGVRLTVDAPGLDLSDVAIGDSIAHGGVCLTVVEKSGHTYKVDVSRETLDCTVGLDTPGEVNLEKALRLADRLGGHLVTGHVDGVGEVLKFAPLGESHELVVRAPKALARYIARKGSITVNGVSLTVNSVNGTDFSINLIPHTVAVTTLKHLAVGSRVNLEIDLIARYLERMMTAEATP